MALSGSATAPVAYTTSGALAVQLVLEWSTHWQDVATNSSLLNFRLYVQTFQYGYMYVGNRDFSISLNGTTIATGNSRMETNSNTKRLLLAVDHQVAHKSDGTYSFNASATAAFNMDFNGWVGSKTVSLSGTLNTIPRASTPSITGTRYLGEALTIRTNRASSSFTHTLTYRFQGATGTIATGVGASTTWTPPLSFANSVTNATSAECTIICTTYNGSTSIGTQQISFNLLIPTSMVPTLTSSTITDTAGYYNTYGAYVQGKSVLSVAIQAAGTYGSTINGYSAAIGYYNPTYQSGATVTGLRPYTAGSDTVNISARDTRGRTIRGTRAITVASYAMPTIAASARRINSSGVEDDESNTVRLTISGSVHNVNNRGVNAGTVRVYVKQDGDDGYTGSAIYTQNRGQSWNFTWNTTVTSNTTGFDFRVTVTDSFGEVTTVECSVGYAQPLMDFRSGGKGIAIGRIASMDGFMVGWDTLFDKQVQFQGNIAGIRRHAYRSSGTDWVEIARSTEPHTSNGAYGFIRIRGQIGGWTADSFGPVDIFVPTRGYSPSRVYVAACSPNVDTSTVNVMVTLDNSGYVHVYLVCTGYYQYDVYVECWQSEVINEVQSSSGQTDPDYTWYLSSDSMFLDIYPVGSIVLRYDHTSPASLYGGSWTRISSRFLYATGSTGTIGATGGSSTHTLTQAQIPAHSHNISVSGGSLSGAGVLVAANAGWFGGYISSVGGGDAHNNNPAFINVSAWRRTA